MPAREPGRSVRGQTAVARWMADEGWTGPVGTAEEAGTAPRLRALAPFRAGLGLGPGVRGAEQLDQWRSLQAAHVALDSEFH